MEDVSDAVIEESSASKVIMMMDTRLTTHGDVSTAMARYDDRKLAELLEREAVPLGTGIGGASARLEVGGTLVFVKRVPLTEPELRHPHSTANLFGMPPFCQYGIGSPGFGAWRELAAHTMYQWLDERVSAGDADRACALADQRLREAVSFMNKGGLLHFDAHFENILTDGHRFYLTDFGQAVSTRFDLSEEEQAFYHRHLTFDRTYTLTYLVNWLAGAFHGVNWQGRRELVRQWAAGQRPAGVPGGVATLLSRQSPLATVLNDFYHDLQSESRKTAYPLEEIRQVAGRHALPLD
ncbi:protein kinase family protein [Nonomuraea jiangxiensis]|uniref:Protein kinase domain-containing protein n=1 Tax=Nonomuraea jiangxiensis TaxID=633440 RepID=A0A1G9Q8K4_9ACTN|nr:protein kinase family protein [Nonomuraea jiangxiensis]SDM07051.1 hypothetical protein SAMN05421869_13580 [Nonomuraea jiangxiensis]